MARLGGPFRIRAGARPAPVPRTAAPRFFPVKSLTPAELKRPGIRTNECREIHRDAESRGPDAEARAVYRPVRTRGRSEAFSRPPEPGGPRQRQRAAAAQDRGPLPAP